MSLAFCAQPQPAAAQAQASLAEDGFCILRSLVAPDKVKALYADLQERFERTPFCRGDFYGARTKRFGALLARSDKTEAFVRRPEILAIADKILGPHCDCYQLNLTQALEIHPGEVRQAPHRDQGMWRAPPGACEYLINVMWPFTPYTAENGATLLYRGSHRPSPDRVFAPWEARPAEMQPGDALIFLGSTLHGAGANRSKLPRAGMVISYALGWLKPYENQWLVYPPAIAKRFSPELAALVGYREHRPNLGNYEGRCPSILLGEVVADYLGAVDNVRADQAERLAAFRAEQIGLFQQGAQSYV